MGIVTRRYVSTSKTTIWCTITNIAYAIVIVIRLICINIIWAIIRTISNAIIVSINNTAIRRTVTNIAYTDVIIIRLICINIVRTIVCAISNAIIVSIWITITSTTTILA